MIRRETEISAAPSLELDPRSDKRGSQVAQDPQSLLASIGLGSTEAAQTTRGIQSAMDPREDEVGFRGVVNQLTRGIAAIDASPFEVEAIGALGRTYGAELSEQPVRYESGSPGHVAALAHTVAKTWHGAVASRYSY